MSAARSFTGPWLRPDVQSRVPSVHREFDLNRDPYVARQILDLGKTEKERRDEAAGRGTSAARRDKPEPALKPPPEMRGNADREGWLTAQRDEAFARAAAREARLAAAPEADRTPTRDSPEPSR